MTLLTLSIAPVLCLFIFFYIRDLYEKEPARLLWKTYFLGALTVIPVCLIEKLIPLSAVTVGNEGLIAVFIFSFLIAGCIEEGAKYIVLRYYAYPKKDFNEPYDGIMYAVMVSLGFATVENVFFVCNGGITTGVVRGLLAVPAHALFAVVMGYYVGLARFAATFSRRRKLLFAGWAWAVAFHGLYDFLVLSKIAFLIVLVIPLVLIFWRLAFKATKEHAESSPFKESIM